jgi:transposase
MARRKLSEAQEAALMEDYYHWEKFNPDSESAEELAGRHGISKPTLYNIKDRWEKEHGDPARQKAPAEAGADLEGVIRYLTEELIKARVRIEQLETIAAQNRAMIEELRGDVPLAH